MVQKRGIKAINKLCVREILGLSLVCGAYFFEFRGWKQGRYACALRLFHACPTNETCFTMRSVHIKWRVARIMIETYLLSVLLELSHEVVSI